MKHAETHPTLDVDGCFACRISGLTIGVSDKFKSENVRESILSKDLAAYKRLRADGTQPKQIDGSANVESRAQEKWQVNSGVLPDRLLHI